MVYHKLLSMSLKSPRAHFLTAQSPDGEVLSVLVHVINCKLKVLFCTTHTHTHSVTAPCSFIHVQSPSPSPISRDHLGFGSCDLALLDWGHFGFLFFFSFGICISGVHLCCTTDALPSPQRISTCPGLFSFSSNTEETHTVVFCFHPPSSFTQHETLLQASQTLKLISPLFMNAKIIYQMTWRRDSCIALFIINNFFFFFSRSKRSLYASTATWRNAMYVFGLAGKPNPQGKTFQFGGQ